MFHLNKIVKTELDREREMLALYIRRIDEILSVKEIKDLRSIDLDFLIVSLNDAAISAGKIQSLRGVLYSKE